jgi:hypothetical protein
MKVAVHADDGAIVWWRTSEPAAGFTTDNYLRDGTQQKIIAALVDALAEARGQLGGFSLQVVDTVTDIRGAPAKVDCCIPVAVTRDRDAGG